MARLRFDWRIRKFSRRCCKMLQNLKNIFRRGLISRIPTRLLQDHRRREENFEIYHLDTIFMRSI